MFREEPYEEMNALLSRDRVAVALGVRMLEHSTGRCLLEMTVDDRMLNAYGACHGAVIYALADIAFAVACNSSGVKSVGLSVNIHYRRPVGLGEKLVAEAWEESSGTTTALCRIKVTNGEGKLVATADGLAYRMSRGKYKSE
ncbi:MAG: hotdog fold thioesterase [Candidatus Verstraetearchaeota archaeon]|nr:hotdog fold thioesterase [Candidatus Verstraetearchaeota archaeon]